ncbi:MAG: hypothetical protein M5R36_14580 [Deltaproteobacteria bacterium]|nr:hypothetical protein [Deltaproteobacteria bacterium]
MDAAVEQEDAAGGQPSRERREGEVDVVRVHGQQGLDLRVEEGARLRLEVLRVQEVGVGAFARLFHELGIVGERFAHGPAFAHAGGRVDDVGHEEVAQDVGVAVQLVQRGHHFAGAVGEFVVERFEKLVAVLRDIDAPVRHDDLVGGLGEGEAFFVEEGDAEFGEDLGEYLPFAEAEEGAGEAAEVVARFFRWSRRGLRRPRRER